MARCTITPEYKRAWRRDRQLGILRTVDAIGTRRRLQALARQGWSRAELARRSGLTRNAFGHIMTGRHLSVRKFVAVRVDQLYNELWDRTPNDTPAARRCARDAIRRGWAPACAWDDIDDPRQVPHGVRAAA